jgi:hypothetical protein
MVASFWEENMRYLTIAALAVLTTSTAFAGKGDKPYYCPASVSAAGAVAQPECAGASEYLRKLLRIGEFEQKKQRQQRLKAK